MNKAIPGYFVNPEPDGFWTLKRLSGTLNLGDVVGVESNCALVAFPGVRDELVEDALDNRSRSDAFRSAIAELGLYRNPSLNRDRLWYTSTSLLWVPSTLLWLIWLGQWLRLLLPPFKLCPG